MSTHELPIIEIAPGIILTDDYRSGVVHGQPMDFSENQSIVIEVMVEGYQQHGIKTWHNEKLMPFVREDYFGRYVRDEFREKRKGKTLDHPAWGKLIRPAPRRGFVELILEP